MRCDDEQRTRRFASPRRSTTSSARIEPVLAAADRVAALAAGRDGGRLRGHRPDLRADPLARGDVVQRAAAVRHPLSADPRALREPRGRSAMGPAVLARARCWAWSSGSACMVVATAVGRAIPRMRAPGRGRADRAAAAVRARPDHGRGAVHLLPLAARPAARHVVDLHRPHGLGAAVRAAAGAGDRDPLRPPPARGGRGSRRLAAGSASGTSSSRSCARASSAPASSASCCRSTSFCARSSCAAPRPPCRSTTGR